jgi:NAD(P)-dependent dehydrogenase (short-subunit alcohol dehydrogenase family)
MAKRTKVALVTGGNRGLGFEICRGLAKAGCSVILAGRDELRVNSAVKKLSRSRLDVVGLTLDVTEPTSVAAAERFVRREFGRLQILVNNAAIYIDHPHRNEVVSVDIETIRASYETNFYGPLRLIQAFLPLMKKQNYGRIVNVSSRMGQLTGTGAGPHNIGYRSSKTALNSLTRIVAAETEQFNIKCNAVTPGWVRTEMGGPKAERTAKKGAESILWLALLGNDSPTGGFFADKTEIPW